MVSRILLAGLVSAITASSAIAQGSAPVDLIATNNAWNARLNARMAATTNAIVNRNLNDPLVQAAYRRHLAQGGHATPHQFAYWYAATAGGTPQGIAAFRANEAVNRARELNAANRYFEAQAARGQAQADYADGFQRNNAEFGHLLRGNSTHVDPSTGGTYVLPHTNPANRPYSDAVGNWFRTDDRGNQYLLENGRWRPLVAGR